MRILLIYHNFIRDFRGYLLLAEMLKKQGHKVWIIAHWNDDIYFAKVLNVDLIVTGQIAESSTYYIAEFAKENNIRLVINSTENIAAPGKYDAFIRYNNESTNEDFIDLQTIAMRDIYEFILKTPNIKDKSKYKLIGFPRFDLSTNVKLRQTENAYFRKKYSLDRYNKVFIYISSILLEGAFEGLTEKDRETYNVNELLTKHKLVLMETTEMLQKLIENEIGDSNLLLIKKHPWDCSSYFYDTFNSTNCKIIDSTEYIVPCLNNSDFIIHSFSTSAMEAWLMKKKTISYIPEIEKSNLTYNHMEDEVIVHNYKEISKVINNYPTPEPFIKTNLFNSNYDGLATLRLAYEIDKIKPYKNKTVFRIPFKTKFKVLALYHLRNIGFKKYDIHKFSGPNTKSRDLLTWENQRPFVIKIYKEPIKQFIKQLVDK